MEVFIDIVGYEGMYQISNLGNIKSLSKKFFLTRNNCIATRKEKMLNPTIKTSGYLYVNLCKNGEVKSKNIHQLVVMSFLNHVPDGSYNIVVDHIDNNKLNNNLTNLQLVSNRYNVTKSKINKNGFTGVYPSADKKRWISRILVNKKKLHLGTFDSKTEAFNAYQNAFKKTLNK